MTWRGHLLAGALLTALTTIAVYPLCGLAFRCGCLMVGLGGADRCNVHQPMGPHCPWCEHAWLGTAGMVLTLLFQGLVYLLIFNRARSSAAAGFASVLALPPAAALAAFLTWLPTDYPHFLARETRRTLGLPNGPIRTVVPAPPPLPRAEGPAAVPSGP
jgi:hypothetical protein